MTLNQIATIEKVTDQGTVNGMGRYITARFHSTGEAVTVATKFKNAAECLDSESQNSLTTNEQMRFFINAIN